MSAVDNTQLDLQREEIDKIDISVWSLLQKRFAITKEVARIKKDFKLPVLDEKREEHVLSKIDNLDCEKEVKTAIAQIYELVFELSRKYQGE